MSPEMSPKMCAEKSPERKTAVIWIGILLMIPFPAFAQLGGLGASPGSLYSPSGRLADATRDLRANQAGDIITILVSENTTATATGGTNTSRKSSAKNQITALAGPVPAGGALANLLDLTNAQQLQGTGQTNRAMALSNTITARVVDVSPSGMLMVEGTKEIMVNSERQVIALRGMVRPTDLSTANAVPSTRIADLQLFVNGKGVVEDAIKRPFFLYRILMGLLPF
jgi:flagellar L-ring protein FlgH